jgi:hypothetical protein
LSFAGQGNFSAASRPQWFGRGGLLLRHAHRSQAALAVLRASSSITPFGLLEDQTFFAIDQHLGTRPFAGQHVTADFDIERNEPAVLIARAGPTALRPRSVSPLPCREG